MFGGLENALGLPLGFFVVFSGGLENVWPFFSSSWVPNCPPWSPFKSQRGPLGSSPAAAEWEFNLLTTTSELLRRLLTSSTGLGEALWDRFLGSSV